MRVFVLGAILVAVVVGAGMLHFKVNIPFAPIPLWEAQRDQFMQCDARIKWLMERVDPETRKLLIVASVNNHIDPVTPFVVIATELQDYLHADQFQDLFPVVPIGATHGLAQMSLVPIKKHKLLRWTDLDGLGMSNDEFKAFQNLRPDDPIPTLLGIKIKRRLRSDAAFTANLLAREISYIHSSLRAGVGTELTYANLFMTRTHNGGVQVKTLPPSMYNVHDTPADANGLRAAMLDYATVGAYQSDKLLQTKVNLGNPFDTYNEGDKRYYNKAFLHAENSTPWSLCFRSAMAQQLQGDAVEQAQKDFCRGVNSSVFRMNWPPSCSLTMKKGRKIQTCQPYLKPEEYQSLWNSYLGMEKSACK